jgi:hypothetical protein
MSNNGRAERVADAVDAVDAVDAAEAAEAALEAAAAHAASADDDTDMVPPERLNPSMRALVAKARGEIDRAPDARNLDKLCWLARRTTEVLEHCGRRYQAAMEALIERAEAHDECRKRARELADENDALRAELRGMAQFRKISDARRRPLD